MDQDNKLNFNITLMSIEWSKKESSNMNGRI